MTSSNPNPVRKILDFKVPDPSFILTSLQIIDGHLGDWNAIQSNLITAADHMGWHAKKGNIVSAYVTPTLRNLKLTEGSGARLSLTSDGTQCLEAYDQKGQASYLSRLGVQLINVDRESGSLFQHLLSKHPSDESAISSEQLKEELFQLGHQEAIRGTRVSSWLSLLKFVGLIVSKSGKYHASSYQYEAFQKGDREVDPNEFLSVLEKQYQSARRRVRGSSYVPIPELRDAVCSAIKISSFRFDNMLRKVIRSSDRLMVVPATPISREEGGLTVGKKYYYFIAVYPRDS